LRAFEDDLCQLQAKDAEIRVQKYKNIELQCQLDTIKLERTSEVWILKKEIENL
jgi:hypothetical protein